MSTPGGAVTPYPTSTIQGDVVQPAAVVDPVSFAAHDFFGLIKELVHKAGFHTEEQVLSAMRVVDAYEKRVVPAKDQRHVVSETDRAGVEDVSLRKGPQVGMTVAAQGQPIDYARLAAAIVAAQRDQAAQSQAPAQVITTVP
jgi:hypothetical protein